MPSPPHWSVPRRYPRHMARHVSVGPDASAFSPSHRRSALLRPTPRGWAVCVVVGPAWSSFGPPSRLWVLCLVIWFSVLLVGRSCGRWAHRVGVRPSVWSFDRPRGCLRFAWPLGSSCGRAALRVVAVPLAQSPRRRWAVRVFVGPFASLGDPRRVPGVLRRVGVGKRVVSRVERRRKAENGPRRESWPVFVTHHLGLPLPRFPLVFLLHIPWSSKIAPAHIPLGRGGAGMGGWPELGAMGGEGRGSGRT